MADTLDEAKSALAMRYTEVKGGKWPMKATRMSDTQK